MLLTSKRLCLLVFVTLATACAAFASASSAHAATGVKIEWGSLTSKSNDNGKFKQANREAARILKQSGAFERIAAVVNSRLNLPREIPIFVSDVLPQIGPAYLSDVEIDGEKQSFINVPGFFLTLTLEAMRENMRGEKGVSVRHMMIDANEFVIAHEIGHALVHQLDLPVTGREEDAVDGFAFYLLNGTPGFGPRKAISAAVLFAALTDLRGEMKESDFADEHSTHEQRVYQFLCWAYGSDKMRFRPLVGKDLLPKERAARCGDEYKQLTRSWDRLLADHLTDAVKVQPAAPAAP